MDHFDVVTLGLLLFVACLVAIVTRRIGLPYAIGLVVAGIVLSLGGYQSRIALTPELIFTFLLPPLVFEASLHLGWRDFKRKARWYSPSRSSARCFPRLSWRPECTGWSAGAGKRRCCSVR